MEIRRIDITAGGEKYHVPFEALWGFLAELPQDEPVELEMDTNKNTINRKFDSPSDLSYYIESFLDNR